MKLLVIAASMVCMALSTEAQLSPVSVDVKISSKKKDTSVGFANTASYSQSRALTITLHNGTAQPVNGLTLRWGIVRSNTFASYGPGGAHKPHTIAYGAEETLDLRPNETKVIETASVEAEGHRGYAMNYGEKILGHGVQVLIAGKVVTENFTPPNLKPYFEKLQPIDSADKEEDGPGNDRKGLKPKPRNN